MRKNWTRILGLDIGFDTAAAGGGTAVAAPPAAAAAPAAPPAAAPAAPPAPAPAKSGYFAGLKRSSSERTPAVATPAAAPASTPAADQKKETPPAAKTEAPKTETPPAAPAASPAVNPEALSRPFLNRADVKTLVDAEKLFLRSQAEGIRLFQESKSQSQKITDLEARLASAQKEIEVARKIPALPDLNDEQLTKLWQENPRQAMQYERQKEVREASIKAESEAAERHVREANLRRQETAAKAGALWDSMSRDTKAYPKFADVSERIDAIYEETKVNGSSFIDELPNGPAILYDMAMGRVYRELLGKGVEAQAEAAEAARKKSEDAARAAAGPTAGSDGGAVDSRTAKEKADADWREKMRSTGRPSPGERIFKARG